MQLPLLTTALLKTIDNLLPPYILSNDNSYTEVEVNAEELLKNFNCIMNEDKLLPLSILPNNDSLNNINDSLSLAVPTLVVVQSPLSTREGY